MHVRRRAGSIAGRNSLTPRRRGKCMHGTCAAESLPTFTNTRRLARVHEGLPACTNNVLYMQATLAAICVVRTRAATKAITAPKPTGRTTTYAVSIQHQAARSTR